MPVGSFLCVGLVISSVISSSNVVLLVTAAVVAFLTWRTKSHELWKSNYEAMKEERDLLRSELTEAKNKIQILERRPELTALLEQQNVLLNAFKSHDETERKLWEKMLHRLDVKLLEESP